VPIVVRSAQAGLLRVAFNADEAATEALRRFLQTQQRREAA
jgi:hypothetical protein